MGPVTSLIHVFNVKKGQDIRLVYNATSCGLNDCLYAPHFGLPVVGHTFRSLSAGYYQADMDVGEMFLNFPLHEELRALAGVGITHLRNAAPNCKGWELERTSDHERWSRNLMGLTDSPYRSLQLLLKVKAKHVAYGNQLKTSNPFGWSKVVLNLPGSNQYDPSLTWVMKVQHDGHMACEVYI